MAGEILKREALCLSIRPWSQTSHVVVWLTPDGRVSTMVKGAIRPKSAFLGQYDLNYTCEILYYARAHGELHALRECTPLERRDALRGNYRALSLADYFRTLAAALSPQGPECADWYAMLAVALDGLSEECAPLPLQLIRYELKVLHLLGLSPEIEATEGAFALHGERTIPIEAPVAALFKDPADASADPIACAAAVRALGVYYAYHVEIAADVRRTAVRMIQTTGLM